MVIKRRWFQLGIRELLAAALIVALAIMLYWERRDHWLLRGRYEAMLPRPYLSIEGPESRMPNSATFGITGTLFHSHEYDFKQSPSVTVRLVDPRSRSTVFETQHRELVETPAGHIFAVNMRRPAFNHPPGVYLLVAEVYDGDKLITDDMTTVDLIAWQEVQALTQSISDNATAKAPTTEGQPSEE